MKKLTYIAACACIWGFSSCADTFLDLEPLDTKTDVVYFQTPEHFREYATGLYGQLLGWQSRYGSIFDHMDCSSDLSTYFSNSQDVGFGKIVVGSNDSRWDNCYANIRAVNMLFQKAESYGGDRNDLAQSLGEGYFFRAYSYFYLLKFFGGVPIVQTVLDVDSPELRASRNSRYEVVDLILSDLDKAIEYLPNEQNIPSEDKGRISKGGAEAFKARVLLYEATWRKYNGTSTDFEGSAGPQSDQVNAFLEEAIALCDEVMADPVYSLWNYNSVAAMQNMSNRYLFCIESEGSNPAGKGKDTNKEFILYSVYDQKTRPASIDLTQTLWKLTPSRKLIDMFVCTDGLPIDKSPKFQGYQKRGDEFKNRDYRLKSYIGTPDANTKLTGGNAGYIPYKFTLYGRNTTNKDEYSNYPVLRLAEVYLNYAEAVYERYGEITNEQLNKSINKLRGRAGVASLTNELVTENGLDMLTEIRRERTVELYMEGFRYDDLKRWGKLEEELNESRCGMVVGEAGYPTDFVDNAGNAILSEYTPNVYIWGTEKVETGTGMHTAIVLAGKSDIQVSKSDYLWPIPQRQIDLNPNLVQNPGY